MSELLKQIREDQLQARKIGDKLGATILTTLIGEASPSGNETTDDKQVEQVVRKFSKGVKEMLQHTTDAQKQHSLESELAMYEKYLPKQLTELELERIVINMIDEAGCSNVGQVMKEMNRLYSGRFDGKIASQLAKDYIEYQS